MSKKKKEPEAKKDDNVESIEWKEITYQCPVRGTVTQKVKVIKLKPQKYQGKDIVRTSGSMFDEFEMTELTGQPLDDDDPMSLPIRDDDND